MKLLPIRTSMCDSCPFRKGSKLAKLAGYLSQQAISTGSRICHSTGISAVKGVTGKPEKLCRGARDFQLRFFHGNGFLREPTDACWKAKLEELEMEGLIGTPELRKAIRGMKRKSAPAVQEAGVNSR